MQDFVLFIEGNKSLKYGYGTYIKNIINILIKYPSSRKIIILKTDCLSEVNVRIKKWGKLTLILAPSFGNNIITSQNNSIQNEISKRIIAIIYPFIFRSKNLTIWVNSVNYLNVCKEIKAILKNSKIFYTHHSFSWKYFHKYNDEHFVNFWHKNRNKINRIAVELTTNQIELCNISSLVITVTEHAAAHFNALRGYVDKNILTIYNFSDLNINTSSKKNIRKKYGIHSSEFVILYVGRLSEDKGIYELIKSIYIISNKIPNIRLILAGGGINDKLIDLSRSIFSNISFIGELNKKDLSKFYRIADIGVIPSFHEQCSLVSIEMRIAKIPLIVSDVDGLKEMFKHEFDCLKLSININSLLNRSIDPNEITNNIMHLYNSKELRNRLTDNGYRKYLLNFKKEVITNEYYKVLNLSS